MAHQYGLPIEVASLAGEPQRFTWRGRAYLVVAILATWHLRDRWWDPPRDGGPLASSGSASDRHYYRVQCADGLLCDIYYDAADGTWVLDRVHD